MAEIEVKALINKKKNKVLFIESNADLLDVLFSFLTMPMGTIIKLTENKKSCTTIGSMNNLYKSVEFLDLKYFRTNQCKAMLLRPKNVSENRIKKIGLAPGNEDHFVCPKSDCTQNLVSHYQEAYCHCGKFMDKKLGLLPVKMEDEETGVFVKGVTKYVISDELQIAPLSTATTFSLLSEQGIKNGNCKGIEEKNFRLGKNEVLTLLKSLLVSKAPLTDILLKNRKAKLTEILSKKLAEILLKNRKVKGLDHECFGGITLKKRTIKLSSGESAGDLSVKLFVSKSKETVIYAEANEDFIDLLFSFLIIPLGNVVKPLQDNSSKACVHNLYQSVEGLDATAHLSEQTKRSLLSPPIQWNFGIKKQLLDLKEFGRTCNEVKGATRTRVRELKYLDPKSKYNSNDSNSKKTKNSSGGYVKAHAMFTVTDNLVIKPISPLSGLSILKELNIPLSDIKERIVHVGKEEATRLMVASFISKSPLTDVFIREVPRSEY